MNSCLRALMDTGTSLFVTVPPRSSDAPYEEVSVSADVVYKLEAFDRDHQLESALRRFDPDVLMIVSWHHAAYRACAVRLHRPLRVLCMDNQWLATPKQRLGILTRALFVERQFDLAFLPGQRQREFARRLGFPDDRIFEGLYSADTNQFFQRSPLTSDGREAFIFVGRVVPEKGIETLIESYSMYRDSVESPWGLVVAGTGALSARLRSVPGVRMMGFVQPQELPAVFEMGRFLVLPSQFEPWGVVLHEAAASGLGIICSNRVGASDYFVEDGKNGRIVGSNKADSLAGALRWAHALSQEELLAASFRSRDAAQEFSPKRWAETVRKMDRSFRRYV